MEQQALEGLGHGATSAPMQALFEEAGSAATVAHLGKQVPSPEANSLSSDPAEPSAPTAGQPSPQLGCRSSA